MVSVARRVEANNKAFAGSQWGSEAPTEAVGLDRAAGPASDAGAPAAAGPASTPGRDPADEILSLLGAALGSDEDGASGGLGAEPPGYLVGTGHNSAKTKPKPESKARRTCPSRSLLHGECEHEAVRWRYVPCGRRDCEVCGPVGRYRIAERIALGARQFWPAAWLVLTFDKDVTKKEAVKRLGRFVRWLRRRTKTSLEYAATFELTKAGRLHINLIIGPWTFVPHSELRKHWGARVSVEWVKDTGAAGTEAAKSYSPETLGGYLSKLEQSVPEDRRVSYSKHWPKLPDSGFVRKGKIRWRPVVDNEDIVFDGERINGEWVEIRPGAGEYRSQWGEPCGCFEYEDG